MFRFQGLGFKSWAFRAQALGQVGIRVLGF